MVLSCANSSKQMQRLTRRRRRRRRWQVFVSRCVIVGSEAQIDTNISTPRPPHPLHSLSRHCHVARCARRLLWNEWFDAEPRPWSASLTAACSLLPAGRSWPHIQSVAAAAAAAAVAYKAFIDDDDGDKQLRARGQSFAREQPRTGGHRVHCTATTSSPRCEKLDSTAGLTVSRRVDCDVMTGHV